MLRFPLIRKVRQIAEHSNYSLFIYKSANSIGTANHDELINIINIIIACRGEWYQKKNKAGKCLKNFYSFLRAIKSVLVIVFVVAALM